MARVTIRRSCGHDERIRVRGPRLMRQGKIAIERRSPCGHCNMEKKVKNLVSSMPKWPELTGDPDEVCRAEEIRTQCREAAAYFFRTAFARNPANAPHLAVESKKTLREFASHTDAAYWLEDGPKTLNALVEGRKALR